MQDFILFKLKVLAFLEKGGWVKQIALDFGTGKTTVKDWKKMEQILLSSVSSDITTALMF